MSFKVEHISKKYGEFVALEDLSFEMKSPGIFALLGTNGAGKTTAIRVILGMLARESGEVFWKGREFQAVNESVGYLSEERGLYPKYTVLEQMYYFAELKGMSRADAKKSIDYWFERLSIDEYRKKNADQLSKGNQQKVQMAAALVSNPEVLVLDEPLSGLDPVNADLFKSIIREEKANNKYIIMCSHQMATIEEFCSELVILNRSRVVLQGDLNEIKKEYGRVKLTVKAEGDILPFAKEYGIQLEVETPNGIEFRVGKQEQADRLLQRIITEKMPLIKFELREPSLHEIFVEKVGNQQDE